jgi:anti-sigma regulatory factor (Ser/Thr protein kinase)
LKFTEEIVNAIKTFIIENVSSHANDILTTTVDYFHISKPTANKYFNELIESQIIKRDNNGRYPNYHLVNTIVEKTYSLENKLEEDIIWRNDFLIHLSGIAQNIKQACQYGFTEMVNNAIDHSGSKEIKLTLILNAKEVRIEVLDFGIGIFNKIMIDLGLDDPKHSILELAKGKFTSDPNKHSGEGIFFTSRIFDFFGIFSRNLSFLGHKDNDWLFENIGRDTNGTLVVMEIKRKSQISIADIFNEYTDPDKQPGFHKTIIPVQLMQYEGESLLSRSQAKRLISRFDRFIEVILDFTGVNIIGQAFADEVFRVFKLDHPNVHLIPVNYNDNIKKMIEHVTSSKI